MVGVLTFMLFGGVSLVEWQMVRGGADRGQMVSLLHRFDHTAGTQVFLYFSLAFTIGLILLAGGLYWSRSVHWGPSARLAVDLGELVGLEVRPLQRRDVLLELGDAARPDERRRHALVAQRPGERELRQALAATRGDLVEGANALEVLFAQQPAGQRLVACGARVLGHAVEVLVGEHALGQRREDDASDALAAEDLEQ